ncbi:unnamed protein product, partial [Ectocarpus fasciculatus]
SLVDSLFFLVRCCVFGWLAPSSPPPLQVEETCSGAVACQLVDSLFPGKVRLHRSNAATACLYCIQLLCVVQVLQSAFDRLHIDKHIDVQRLTRGKYMDNLEFMQ